MNTDNGSSFADRSYSGGSAYGHYVQWTDKISTDISGTKLSDSWGTNDGTLNGGFTTGVSGVGGKEAVIFNGSDGYVSVPDISAPQSITISAWIKWSGATDEKQVICSGGYDGSTTELELLINTDESWSWKTYDGSNHGIVSKGSVPSSRWLFVTAVYNNNVGIYRLFVDGVLRHTSSDSTGPANTENSAKWAIGASSQPTIQKYFEGEIDEVRIYSEALTQQQIWNLYNIGRNANWGYTRS